MEKLVWVKNQVEKCRFFFFRWESVTCDVVWCVVFHEKRKKRRNTIIKITKMKMISTTTTQTNTFSLCVAKQVKWLLLLKIEELKSLLQSVIITAWLYSDQHYENMWTLLTPMKITLPAVNLILFPRDRRPYQSTEWIFSLFFLGAIESNFIRMKTTTTAVHPYTTSIDVLLVKN